MYRVLRDLFPRFDSMACVGLIIITSIINVQPWQQGTEHQLWSNQVASTLMSINSKKNHIIVNLRTAKTTEEDTMIFVENTEQLEK